jgi:hypothetical protein
MAGNEGFSGICLISLANLTPIKAFYFWLRHRIFYLLRVDQEATWTPRICKVYDTLIFIGAGFV